MTEILRPGWGAPGDRRYLYAFGLDPGVTTGWAAFRIDWDLLLAQGFTDVVMGGRDPEVFAWEVGELTGSENGQVDQVLARYRGLWAEGVWNDGEDSDVLVGSYESFRLRMMGDDATLLAPVRLLAKLGYVGRALPFPVVQHAPRDAKDIVTDARLRRWGLWVPGGPDHMRDAVRQAVMVTRKMVEGPFRAAMLRRCQWISS